MQFKKGSIFSPILIGILLLYTCALSTFIPSRQDVRAFEDERRTALPASFRRDHPTLSKRDLDPPVPSVDDCKGQLSVDRNKVVFYTSIVEESAKTYAASIGRKTIWEAGLTSYKNTLEARAKQVFNSGGQPWAAEDSANFFINCSPGWHGWKRGDTGW